MDIEQVREFALTLEGTDESMPFGDSAVVYKVAGKMFLLVGLEIPFMMTVKCDPLKGEQLIEEHPDTIRPGYHMNKKHWLTIDLEGGLSDSFIKERIVESRKLVIEKLPMKVRNSISS